MTEPSGASRSTAPNGGSEGSTPGSSYQVSPPAENDTSAADRIKITRKSHRKSRLGCRNCKTRRIKCDEDKPKCGNCRRLNLRCDYAFLIGSRPGSHNRRDSIAPSTELPISEIELTYHWSTSTYQSLSAWNTGALKWRSAMQDIAFDHPHALQLMLSLTALHLAYCRPERREEYVSRSDQFYGQALSSLTSELANVSADNYEAVVTSVQLLCFVGLGRGPQPGEYLAFSDGERQQSEWLIMFRGVRTTREISAGQCELNAKLPGSIDKKAIRPLPEDPNPPDFERQLQDLYGHVDFVTSHDETAVYAVDLLIEYYRSRYSGKEGEYHVTFGWLYRMKDKFFEQLQSRDPISLIIYAHFTVLLQDLERFWYMKGWTHHVMAGIWRALPVPQRPWLGWPIEQVGWIPPQRS